MIGTLINTATIFLGSIIGSLLKKGFHKKYQTVLYDAMGLATSGLGLHTIIENMSRSTYPVLFIVSLSLGGLLGTAIGLDKNFNLLLNKYSKTNLGQGLSTAIFLFCLGTLSILGPIESALHQNHTLLFTNATLDFVTSIVLASTYGIGIAASALILFIWQGGIFLLAQYSAPISTTDFITEISIIGGFLILSSGLSILKIKAFQTLDLLPAFIVPIIWFSLIFFF